MGLVITLHVAKPGSIFDMSYALLKMTRGTEPGVNPENNQMCAPQTNKKNNKIN